MPAIHPHCTSPSALASVLAALAITTSTPSAATEPAPFPYELNTSRETALIAAGAGLLLTGLLLGDEDGTGAPPASAPSAQPNPDNLPSLDRAALGRWTPAASRASDRLVTILMLAPLGEAAIGPGRQRGGRLALMHVEAQLLAGGVTSLLKHTVRRPRPFTYGDDPCVPDERRLSAMARRSFPSGHAAQSFAAMTILASVHGRLHPRGEGWVWAGGLGVAATVGWLRCEAGAHFPTDVLAGAAIGALAGWLVPRLHEVEGDAGGEPAAGAGLAVGIRF